MLTVISAVVATLDELLDEQALRRNSSVVDAREAVRNAVQSASDLVLSAMPLAGVDAPASLGRTLALPVTLPPPVPTLLRLLAELVDVVRARGFDGLIVPVHIDTLTDTQAAQFLNQSRDITTGQHAPSIHWIFIAGPGLIRCLETGLEYRRISESFTNNPVSLAPLS